jgi:hypothetical protein
MQMHHTTNKMRQNKNPPNDKKHILAYH